MSLIDAQLQERLDSLFEQEISDFGAFETEFQKLYTLVEKKSTAPLRSQFWDVAVPIPSNLMSTYSRINPSEIPGAIYCALGLDKFGSEEDNATTFIDHADSKPFVPLGCFLLANFPERTSNMCKHFFGPDTTGFHFLLKCKPAATESPSVASTEVTRMLDTRQKILECIVGIDETRKKLVAASNEQTMKRLRAVLEEDLETRADSDPEDFKDESDDSDEEAKPSPAKRRKCYNDMGTHRDTDVQKIRLDGITVHPARGVVNMRVRDFRGEPGPHFIGLMGAIVCDSKFSDHLPKPMAPRYSHGAQMDRGKLMHPGADVASNTVVTQKMIDMDGALVHEYNEMHEMANTMRRGLWALHDFARNAFEFIVRVNRVKSGDVASTDHTIESLTVIQKCVIGQLYLHSISIRRHAADESSSESSDEEEDSGSEYDDSEDVTTRTLDPSTRMSATRTPNASTQRRGVV